MLVSCQFSQDIEGCGCFTTCVVEPCVADWAQQIEESDLT